MDREAWWATVPPGGLQRVRHDRVTNMITLLLEVGLGNVEFWSISPGLHLHLVPHGRTFWILSAAALTSATLSPSNLACLALYSCR